MIIRVVLGLVGCQGDPGKGDGVPGDRDGDGYGITLNDCDDDDPSVHPGAPDSPADGVDTDCNGSDFHTTRLETAARLVVAGDEVEDALGTSVACSAEAALGFATSLALGADQARRATPMERVSNGDSPGYAIVVDGRAAGAMHAADAGWRVDGSEEEDELGHRVVFPGDADGDGQGDLVVTAGNAYRAVDDEEPDTQTGAAFLFTTEGRGGVPEDAATWFVGTWGRNLRGAAPVGDVDSDGLADVLLSEVNLADTEAAGEVRLYLAASLAPTVAPSAATVRVAGADPLSPTGDFMVTGDITGDGALDLVLGEIDWPLTGRAVIAAGPPSDWTLEGAIEVIGTGEDASFGQGLALGDLDADGVEDLVVSAHISSKAGLRRGAAYLFSGPVHDDRTADDSDAQLFGEVDGGWMGAAVSVLDHDADGFQDLAVSAASDPYTAPARPGLVYLFAGPLGRGELDPGSAGVIFEGMEGSELLGLRLAACDLNGDGSDDIVIGAPGNADGDLRRGRAFVVDGVPVP